MFRTFSNPNARLGGNPVTHTIPGQNNGSSSFLNQQNRTPYNQQGVETQEFNLGLSNNNVNTNPNQNMVPNTNANNANQGNPN